MSSGMSDDTGRPSAPQTLPAIQRWMQAVITHPGGVAAGVASEAARQQVAISIDAIERVVLPSSQLSSVERLNVYSGAYLARLLECLREEFPVLRTALGEDLFDTFAFGYLQTYPSRSYTLGQLGADFPRYLSETRPEPTGQDMDADWPDLIVDLAGFERAISEVFDGPGVERETLLDRERLLAVPPEQWPEARLAFVPCLRLLATRFPVNDYFSAVRDKTEPTVPEPRDSYVALNRREYVVRRYEISRTQYRLLKELMEGATVSQGIERTAVELTDAEFAEFAAELRGWFYVWAAQGFFRGLAN